jgi:hypothetical protein
MHIALGEMKVPDETIAVAVKLVALHQTSSDCVSHCRYIGRSLLSN